MAIRLYFTNSLSRIHALKSRAPHNTARYLVTMATPSSTPKGRRLVLCFDGTGNKFGGTESDTNVVKLYQMFDRQVPEQFHYYQPGIGTYETSQSSNSSQGNVFTRTKNSIKATVDEGVGTSFVEHVLAGYKFLMRFYDVNDKIYIFGFSRGAYTARFLAEMVCKIGLLSMGNEEMIRFAWNTFSDYQRSSAEETSQREFMESFTQTFCRPGIEIHFLGLFDCVNSVGQFEMPLFRPTFRYMANPPARHIRHAISIHERRLKFRPALFLTDPNCPKEGMDSSIPIEQRRTLKEEWFAGNHGDIGGGWPRAFEQPQLLSDIPLKWMIDEIQDLPDTTNRLAFSTTHLSYPNPPDPSISKPTFMGKVKKFFSSLFGVKSKPLNTEQLDQKTMRPHDMLAFNRGTTFFGVLGWWIIEVLPFFSRLELVNGQWQPRHWPPNNGARRDIPAAAKIHPSVFQLHRSGVLSESDMPKLGGHKIIELFPSHEAHNVESQESSRGYSRSGGP